MFKFKISKLALVFVSFTSIVLNVNAQQVDTTKNDRFSVHFQTTIITQYKPAFSAKYSGSNSLSTVEENTRSTTSTLFLGARLWTGASVFVNPEIAAGSGLSGSVGVAASSNGETYRIDNPSPAFELARLFFRQVFTFSKKAEYTETEINHLGGLMPTNYLSVVVGKICLADYFDNNSYSHDPRTQFMSWGLMSNGAWDFPANTRGYTPSIVLEYVSPVHELRYAFSLVPKVANAMEMNWDINNSGSHTLEYTHNHTINGLKGTIRLVSFFTTANMGSYNAAIALNPTAPSLAATKLGTDPTNTTPIYVGRTKYGFGINAEQALGKYMGAFFRASWNDGNNETWAFTEIDRSVSLGLSTTGGRWNRPNDVFGLACVTSGLSDPHKNYLAAGGKGFELGDGKLNYGLESLTETYYAMQIAKNLTVSGAYQFIVNPGYNQDRGPVNVFSVRLHTDF